MTVASAAGVSARREAASRGNAVSAYSVKMRTRRSLRACAQAIRCLTRASGMLRTAFANSVIRASNSRSRSKDTPGRSASALAVAAAIAASSSFLRSSSLASDRSSSASGAVVRNCNCAIARPSLAVCRRSPVAFFACASKASRWTLSVHANASIEERRRFWRLQRTSADAVCADFIAPFNRSSRAWRYSSSSCGSASSIVRRQPGDRTSTTSRTGKPPSSAGRPSDDGPSPARAA